MSHMALGVRDDGGQKTEARSQEPEDRTGQKIILGTDFTDGTDGAAPR